MHDINRPCRRFVCGFLILVAVLLSLAAAAVAVLDPAFQYHLPLDGVTPVYQNERYQNAGLAKHLTYDTVILGSSVTANFRPSQFNELFGGQTLKMTYPGACFADFDAALTLCFRKQPVKRVFWSIDPKIVMTDYDAAPIELPDYLYNDNPLDDINYLFNKDVLLEQCGESLLSTLRGDEAVPLDDAFTWDQKYEFSHSKALWSYSRPAWTPEVTGAHAFDAQIDRNLACIEQWVTAHPETEFYLFAPPYSVLFWDRVTRDGTYEAYLTLFDRMLTTFSAYDNVRYYCFAADYDMMHDLNRYTDEVHYTGEVNRQMAETMATTAGMTIEDRTDMQVTLRAIVETFDFDSLFPESMRDTPPHRRIVNSF